MVTTSIRGRRMLAAAAPMGGSTLAALLGDGSRTRRSAGRAGSLVAALAPGVALAGLVVIAAAFYSVPAGALVPSLLVAAVASLLSGFCYSELVTHEANPHRETAMYHLLYQWVGESAAFCAAWMQLLQRAGAAALSCRLLPPCAQLLLLPGGEPSQLPRENWHHSHTRQPPGVDNAGAWWCGGAALAAAGVAAAATRRRPREARAAVSALLLAASLAADIIYVAGAALLRTSSLQAPPGGRHGAAVSTDFFGDQSYSFTPTPSTPSAHPRPLGLMTGAALFVSIFLAPQFSMDGFMLSTSTCRNDADSSVNRAPPVLSRPRAHRDMPCVAVLSTFVNFLFAFALIATMCALRSDDMRVPPDDEMLLVLLRRTNYVNLAVTALSCLGLTLLAALCVSDVAALLSTLSTDGLVPAACGSLGGLPAAASLVALVALLLRPVSLAVLMASGPILLNVCVCLGVLVMPHIAVGRVDRRTPLGASVTSKSIPSSEPLVTGTDTGGLGGTQQQGDPKLTSSRVEPATECFTASTTSSAEVLLLLREQQLLQQKHHQLHQLVGGAGMGVAAVSPEEHRSAYDQQQEDTEEERAQAYHSRERLQPQQNRPEEEEDEDAVSNSCCFSCCSCSEYGWRLSPNDTTCVTQNTQRRQQQRGSQRAGLSVIGLLGCFVLLSVLLERLSERLREPAAAGALAFIICVVALCALALLVAMAQEAHTRRRHQRTSVVAAAAGSRLRLAAPSSTGSLKSTVTGCGGASFHVPMSPFLPALGAFLNVLLFVDLLASNILALLLWFSIGCLVYVLYGARHSLVGTWPRTQHASVDCVVAAGTRDPFDPVNNIVIKYR